MATFARRRGAVPSVVSVPVGTTWLFEEDGTFEVPADGNYQIEMHGGGGGGCTYSTMVVLPNGLMGGEFRSASGGGSGELITLALKKGESLDVAVGIGGTYANGGSGVTGGTGGSTRFGTHVVTGGEGGDAYNKTAGSPSGSIATLGGISIITKSDLSGDHFPAVSGGYGNKNNTAQTYGNGGATAPSGGQNGQPGAVVITYLGA